MDVTARIAEESALSAKTGMAPSSKGSIGYQPGENISIENNVISVLTADDVEQDNTRPITSAAVYNQFEIISALLGTI